MSRRQFLRRAAAIGGLGFAFKAMGALGLASMAHAAPAPELPRDLGRGRKVAILGAGIAGLVLALRLEQAGFAVTLVESRDRLGGRTWTIRDGDRIELAGEGLQTARLSPGLYFNAGPARIPSHHQGLLDYCRRLGVPLEVEVNSSRSALIQADGSFGGRPIQQRQAANDFRGHVSELLAKAVGDGSLDARLTPEDRERLLAFLTRYGDLTGGRFTGTTRSGYRIAPGAADQVGVARAPLSLGDLLGDENLGSILFDETITMQATMFEPVGGMDRIVQGFARALRSRVVTGAEVRRIRTGGDRAQVVWRARSGREQSLTADLVVCTIPLSILKDVDTDFAPDIRAAIAACQQDASAKVAFDAPRFWEREEIYGGLSFSGAGTGAVWYPSSGFHSERGLLVGAYISGRPAEAFEALPLAEQIAKARASVERLHPGHGAELERPLVVNWSKVPGSRGAWARWGSSPADQAAMRRLTQPHGRLFFAGAHLSQLPSWQEGAVASAHHTLAQIARTPAAP